MKAHFLAALLAIAALGAAPAFAHAEMTQSNIADKASLAKAPDAFTASFEEKAAITGLMLMSDAGKHIDLAYKPAKEMSKTLSVPLPKLEPGAYTLSFKAVAKDGHAMMTAIHFAITGG
jgi:methionine-rich copper-binding protein CopC